MFKSKSRHKQTCPKASFTTCGYSANLLHKRPFKSESKNKRFDSFKVFFKEIIKIPNIFASLVSTTFSAFISFYFYIAIFFFHDAPEIQKNEFFSESAET